MKINKDLSKERDFLSDSVTFYKKKFLRPSLETLKLDYETKRQKPDFEENDFIDASGLSLPSRKEFT